MFTPQQDRQVQFIGGGSDGKWYKVSLPFPPTQAHYNPETRKLDWYELRYDANKAPYYHYIYSTD